MTTSTKRITEYWELFKIFKELIAILMVVGPFLYQPQNPDVELTYIEQDFFADNRLTSKSQSGETRMLTIKIHNKKMESLNSIDLEINDISNVFSINGRSPYKRANEKLNNLIEFEENQNSIRLKSITDIPKGYHIQIQIIGSFYDHIFNSRLEFQANTKDVKITEETISSSQILYIAPYLPAIISVVFLLIIVKTSIGLHRHITKTEKVK